MSKNIFSFKPPDNPFNPFGEKREKDNRRIFTKTQKNEMWAQQNGKCAKCQEPLDPRTVEYDHIKPWADKGKTAVVNGAALCPNCHKLKTHIHRLKKTEKKKESEDLFPSLKW